MPHSRSVKCVFFLTVSSCGLQDVMITNEVDPRHVELLLRGGCSDTTKASRQCSGLFSIALDGPDVQIASEDIRMTVAQHTIIEDVILKDTSQRRGCCCATACLWRVLCDSHCPARWTRLGPTRPQKVCIGHRPMSTSLSLFAIMLALEERARARMLVVE